MGRPKEVTDDQILVAARRCFIERGAGVSAAEIARELGVSHTTLFNRFASKEGLMLAALGPPSDVAWIAALEAGPDERPLRTQLVAHGRVMAAYFHDLQAGYGILQAAGLDPARGATSKKSGAAPERAYTALIGFLQRAQVQRRLGACDVDTLAATLLGALQGQAFTTRVCAAPSCEVAAQHYVERLIDLLWHGIAPATPSGRAAPPPHRTRSGRSAPRAKR